MLFRVCYKRTWYMFSMKGAPSEPKRGACLHVKRVVWNVLHMASMWIIIPYVLKKIQWFVHMCYQYGLQNVVTFVKVFCLLRIPFFTKCIISYCLTCNLAIDILWIQTILSNNSNNNNNNMKILQMTTRTTEWDNQCRWSQWICSVVLVLPPPTSYL